MSIRDILPAPLAEAVELLGLEQEFMEMHTSKDPPAKLEWFKERVERKFKKLALKTHPDKGGSTEAMQAINGARDKLLALRISPRKIRINPGWATPEFFAAHFSFGVTTTSSGATTSTDSTTIRISPDGGFRVVFKV